MLLGVDTLFSGPELEGEGLPEFFEDERKKKKVEKPEKPEKKVEKPEKKKVKKELDPPTARSRDEYLFGWDGDAGSGCAWRAKLVKGRPQKKRVHQEHPSRCGEGPSLGHHGDLRRWHDLRDPRHAD